MRLIVLGAAAGGGFPQWNSACPVGRRAWQRDSAARWRSQCSVALSADGERWTLLNASPDLRQQILATPALHPRRGPRHSPIAAVVLTNGDVDHVAGLLTLRESQSFALYATGAILAVLESNPIFNVLNPEFVGRTRLTLEQPVELEGGGTIVPFTVPGKVPLYLEDAAPAIGAETEDVIGLELRSGAGESAFFIPGCANLTSGARRPSARRGAGPVRRYPVDRRRDDSQRDGGEDRRPHGAHEHLWAGRHPCRVCTARRTA